MLADGFRGPRFFFVQDDPVKAFFGRLGKELFRKGDVFLPGKAEAMNDVFDLALGMLNTFGNFDLLFASEQRNLSHLLEIHPNRIVKDIKAGFFFLFLRFRLFDAVHLGLIDDFDLEIAELNDDLLHLLGRGHIIRQRFVEIIIGEIALFLGKAQEFANFFGKLGSNRPVQSGPSFFRRIVCRWRLASAVCGKFCDGFSGRVGEGRGRVGD